MPRVVFMGSPGFAVPAFTALCERPDLCEVVGVVTQPDKPAGRGQKLTSSAIKIAADARRIPVLTPTKLKPPESLEAFAAMQPDLAVVAAYGRILPKAWLVTPKLGCVNLHASLLPRWRGASPINHAILHGDAQSGVGLMHMDEGLDTGAVYAERAVVIASDETTLSLTIKLGELAAKLLIDSLPALFGQSLVAHPQSLEGVTYAPILKKEDGALDFGQPAQELQRRVRAMNPWPLAFTHKGDARVQVLKARTLPTSGTPGVVLAAGPDGVVVATTEGSLVLDEVKPAGKGAMAAAAWAAGRGVVVGDTLGPVA